MGKVGNLKSSLAATRSCPEPCVRIESGERGGEGVEFGAVAKAWKVDRVQWLVRFV